jgi:hypothetical protein
VPVEPSDVNRGVAQTGEPEHTLRILHYLTINVPAACVTWTIPPEILKGINAVMAVNPLDSDRIAADIIESADLRGRL